LVIPPVCFFELIVGFFLAIPIAASPYLGVHTLGTINRGRARAGIPAVFVSAAGAFPAPVKKELAFCVFGDDYTLGVPQTGSRFRAAQ